MVFCSLTLKWCRGALIRMVLPALVLRHHIGDHTGNFLVAWHMFEGDILSPFSFLQVNTDFSKWEDIPILRSGRNASNVFNVQWHDLLLDDRCLIDKDNLIRCHDNEIVRPVDIGLDHIEEDKDQPECQKHRDHPHKWPRENERYNQKYEQRDRNADLTQDGKEERETVVVRKEDNLFAFMAEALLDFLRIGLESEYAHGDQDTKYWLPGEFPRDLLLLGSILRRIWPTARSSSG